MTEFGDEVRRLLTGQGISLRELARRSHYHASHLSNVLNGRKRLTRKMAGELDAVLGADGRLAGLGPPAPAPAGPDQAGGPDMLPDRRSVLAGTILAGRALAGWGPEDPERLAWVARHPPRVDMPVVNALREMLVTQRHIEDSMGGMAVHEPVLAQLATIETLVCQAHGSVRTALLDVAQQWAQFASYLARDADDPAADRMRLAQALEWANEVGDKTMIATVLVQRAYGALHAGQIGTVIGLAQAAQREGSVSAGQRAEAAAFEARGHAMLGDGPTVERKLDEMSELAAKLSDQRQDRHPWLYWMSSYNFLCFEGAAFGLMADNRRYRERAITALRTGYAALPDDLKSSAWAAKDLVRLADVHVTAGDIGRAHATGLQAAAVARRTGSVRLAVMLAQVHARLHSRWPRDPRVAELGEALH